jgi:hypothetical protein
MLNTIRNWFWRVRMQLRHLIYTGHFYRRPVRGEWMCKHHYEQRYGRKTSNVSSPKE